MREDSSFRNLLSCLENPERITHDQNKLKATIFGSYHANKSIALWWTQFEGRPCRRVWWCFMNFLWTLNVEDTSRLNLSSNKIQEVQIGALQQWKKKNDQSEQDHSKLREWSKILVQVHFWWRNSVTWLRAVKNKLILHGMSTLTLSTGFQTQHKKK